MPKQELDFTNYEEGDINPSNVRYEFDVRAHATLTNRDAVNEMRILGLALRRPAYVTCDVIPVVLDGRHFIDSYLAQVPRPTRIRARILPFSWDEVTEAQKAQITAWALKQNMPDAGDYRVFAKTEDVTFTIKTNFLLKGILDKAKIRTLLSYVPVDQFKEAWASAWTSYEQSKIYETQQLMVTKDLTPKKAAETLPPSLQNKFLRRVNGGLEPPTWTSKAGAKAIKDKQPLLDNAYDGIKRYMDTLYERLGQPGYSPEIVEKVLAYHRQTYVQLGERLEKGALVVEKAIQARRVESKAALSRNPNRP